MLVEVEELFDARRAYCAGQDIAEVVRVSEPVDQTDWEDELTRLCERQPGLRGHVEDLRGAGLGPRQTFTWLTQPVTLLSGEVPADLVETNPGRVATAVGRLAARIGSNAAIDQRIQEAVAAANFGADLAARGETVVALDDEGRMVEYRPDGTAVFIGTD